MNNPVSIELLEKYINGKCTPEEVAVVKKWYFSFEDEHDLISDMNLSEERKLEEQIYNRILNNIGFVEEEVELTEQPEEAPRRSYKMWYAAASIAAICLVFLGVLFIKKPAVTDYNQVADSHVQELVLITNNTNQIYKTMLPDSSMVWLSPKAKINFPKKFDSRFRAISMTGECFFEVTKNPKRPFIIKSSSIITKVWGTSFRVRDGVINKEADVSVLTGKVSVSIKNKDNDDAGTDYQLNKNEVMLYPHQKVIYLADKNVLKPESMDEPALQIWNRINLSFEGKPLSEIVPVLNAKFHVQIKVVNEKLNHYILNADMAGFNLPDVLEALKKSLNVNYELKNNIIELE
jgi:transmembrane sensor